MLGYFHKTFFRSLAVKLAVAMSTNQQDKRIRQTVARLLAAVDRSIKAADQVRKAKTDLERLTSSVVRDQGETPCQR